ncbi:MAG: 3-hydroxyacyl-CoA dehydrogenase NAD-binding domain-containing protein [Mariprofundaceae bacterium]
MAVNTQTVELVRKEDVAHLRFVRTDKPVNVLDLICMEQLEKRLDALEKDTPRVLVLESAMPGCFIAGADISLIQSVTDRMEAVRLAERGQAVCRRIEDLPAISIALVQGACMGGGLEVALGCDHIVAIHDAKTQLGLPEIKIGIHPGFGGCVRLPKRIGWPKAVEMILTGRTVDAKRAKRIGLAAIACHAEQTGNAIRYLSEKGKASYKSVNPWWMRLWPVRALFFQQVEKRVLARFRHLDIEQAYPAIPATIMLLRSLVGMHNGQAYAREAESIGALAVTATCKNLIRIFFLGEALKKQTAARDGRDKAAAISHTAVYGGGVMGSGIAWVAAKSTDVDLHEVSEEALGHGMKNIARLAKRDPERMQRIRPVMDHSGLKDAQVVIEAVLEELKIKQALWADVEQHVAKNTLLLTNTSSLSVTDMQKKAKYPGRIAGMHFFNPAPKMPLVEIIAGKKTDARAIQLSTALAVRWGKFPVVTADSPGFLVNRCLMPYMVAALHLLEGGQKITHVDGALKNFGMPMGAFELADRVGMDICMHVGAHLGDAYGDRFVMPDWFVRMVKGGLLGAKSGSGFFTYEGKKRGTVNPGLAKYLPAKPHEKPGTDADIGDDKGIMTDTDIVDACLVPMLIEALACLREKAVEDTGHLDAAMVYGIGFPPFRGGLLHHFSQTKKVELRQKIDSLGLDIPGNLEVIYE